MFSLFQTIVPENEQTKKHFRYLTIGSEEEIRDNTFIITFRNSRCSRDRENVCHIPAWKNYDLWALHEYLQTVIYRSDTDMSITVD